MKYSSLCMLFCLLTGYNCISRCMPVTDVQLKDWKHEIRTTKADIENLHTFIPFFGTISTIYQQLIMGRINNIIAELYEIRENANNYSDSICYTCEELMANAFSLLQELNKPQSA